MEDRTKLVSQLNWYKPKTGQCEADFDVTLENIGKKTFEVSGVRIRVWQTNVEADAKGVSFIDADYFEKKPPFFDKLSHPEDLMGHYAPSIQSQSSFSWFLPEQKDSAAAFRIDIFNNQNKSLGYTRQWSYVFCSEPPNKEKSVETTNTKKSE